MAERLMVGREFNNVLEEAGLIPKGLAITRMVIDIQPDDIIKINYETIADPDLLESVMEAFVKGKDKLIAKKVAERLKGKSNG
jgi:hypothetical protein